MGKAIVIISGGIKKDSGGQWHSTDLNEADNKLSAPGGYLRVLAGKYLWDENKEQGIVATGGKGYDVAQKDPRQPLICEIIKKELMELGASENSIILEKESNNTIDQIKALGFILKKNDFKEAIIISSQWHLPRVRAMVEKTGDLNIRELLKQEAIKLQSAEEVLLKKDRQHWQDKIESAYQSDWLRQRIAMEEKGIADLKAGRYKIKNNTI